MFVRFPQSLEEQRAIGAVLSDMEAEITALEHRRDKTIAIQTRNHCSSSSRQSAVIEI